MSKEQDQDTEGDDVISDEVIAAVKQEVVETMAWAERIDFSFLDP